MHFDDGTTSPFYAFLRASGVSAKNQGAGGSFGFGKGAYFALSPIKTLVVSSKDTNGKVYFEGATRLTTHKDNNDNKISAFGFYDNNNGEPTIKESNIPEIFKRIETGTDINIIGLWDESERKKLMIKSVLNNFWLAIYDEKLVVQIDDVTINKNNLEITIDDYFVGQLENGAPTEIESWNPKSYLKAVKYAKTSNQYLVFEETLPTIGYVKFYVYLDKGLPNRTSYFRTPRMVVFKRTNRKVNGYSAVFVCDNKKGNEMLRLMENPAHNEWKLDNYPKDEGKANKDARRGEIEISEFINRTLESLANIKKGNKIAFIGLEEYLSIPEDLLEKDEEYDFDGMNINNNSGQLTNEETEDESGMQTTNKSENVRIKPKIKVLSDIKKEENVTPDEEGELSITTGSTRVNPNPNPGPIPPGPNGGISNGSPSENPSGSRILKKVKLKVAAQKGQGFFIHNLIIDSDDQIANGELELLVGGDNDKDDGIEIASTDNGIIQGNKLIGVSLSAGKNQIAIRFEDNLKHSIKLKAYEIQ